MQYGAYDMYPFQSRRIIKTICERGMYRAWEKIEILVENLKVKKDVWHKFIHGGVVSKLVVGKYGSCENMKLTEQESEEAGTW
jgi:hypothetical protein